MSVRRSPLMALNDQLYVDVESCGTSVMCLTWDGVPLAVVDGVTLVDVEAVVEWHRKELDESGGRVGNKEAMEALAHALGRFRAGDVTYNDIP